jgi:hypothetical protein
MTDIQCPQCGHRALSVATRCPRCGHEFSAELRHPLPSMPDRPWLRPALTAAGAAAVVLVLALLARGDDGGSGPVSTEPTATPAAPAGDTALSGALPLPPAAPAPAPEALRRYAVEWINVRQRRAVAAPPVRVLRPGEAVLVDSLVRGWYRVVADGQGVGYAHRRFLAASPPAATAR